MPIDKMMDAMANYVPGIKHWWITVYGVVTSFIPVDKRKLLPAGSVNTGDFKCTTQIEAGDSQDCPNPAKFTSIGFFLGMNKDPIPLVEARARNFCPACLYVSMTKALGKVMRPEFFRHSTQTSDEPDADALYIVSERAEYLQFCIQEVHAYMEENCPDELERLNALIMSEQDEDKTSF
jgi:hypothetical protein